jgi:putative acetyltransferase
MTGAAAIRPYRPDDRGAVAGVYYRAVREGAAAFYDEAQREAWAPRDTPDLTRPDKLLGQWCWVAEAGGKVTGFMSLCADGYLDMAFVIPEVMGRGHAALLYDALLAKARAEGLARLSVHASHLARRFLARRGWQVDEVQMHPANGQVFERFAMSLDLAGQSGTGSRVNTS